MRQRNRRPSPALVLSLLALVWAAGGDAFAAGQSVVAHASALITGKQIKNGTITSSDIKAGTIKARNIAPATLKALVGPIGPAGPQGRIGPAGPAGLSTGAAGGDLTGNFPNPTIKGNAINGTKVANGSLTADDVAVASLVQDEVFVAPDDAIAGGACIAEVVNSPTAGVQIRPGDMAFGFGPANLPLQFTIRSEVASVAGQAQVRICNTGAIATPPSGKYGIVVIAQSTPGAPLALRATGGIRK